MLTALGWALVAAIEPLGIIAFIALLGSRGGRRNTLGFIIGWLLCAGVVAVLTVVVAGGSSHSSSSSSVISSAGLLQIALGVLALGFLVVRRRRRSAAPGDASEHTADDAVDQAVENALDPESEPEKVIGPVGAAVIAAMVQGWTVVAAAVAAVLDATSSGVGQTLGILLVIVVSASTYLVAYVLAGLYPEATAAWLERLRQRIETHRDRVIDLLLLGAGAWLVAHGLVVQLSQ